MSPVPAPRDDPPRHALAHFADVTLALLAIASLALLVVEFAVSLPPPWQTRITIVQLLIWGAFAVELAVLLVRERSPARVVRHHWPAALAVVLPPLRITRGFRALRAIRTVRAARGLSLARAAAALNHARQEMFDFARANQFGQVVALTAIVTVTAAAATYYFERDAAGPSGISSFPAALWWASTVVTTINAASEPETLEGRIIALSLRIFGVAIIGYVTATIAVFLFGRRLGDGSAEQAALDDLRREIASLRESVERGERSESRSTPESPEP